MTEFVLRLLKICGRVPLSALRDYFGFSDGEALAVVESLSLHSLAEETDAVEYVHEEVTAGRAVPIFGELRPYLEDIYQTPEGLGFRSAEPAT